MVSTYQLTIFEHILSSFSRYRPPQQQTHAFKVLKIFPLLEVPTSFTFFHFFSFWLLAHYSHICATIGGWGWTQVGFLFFGGSRKNIFEIWSMKRSTFSDISLNDSIFPRFVSLSCFEIKISRFRTNFIQSTTFTATSTKPQIPMYSADVWIPQDIDWFYPP